MDPLVTDWKPSLVLENRLLLAALRPCWWGELRRLFDEEPGPDSSVWRLLGESGLKIGRGRRGLTDPDGRWLALPDAPRVPGLFDRLKEGERAVFPRGARTPE